MSHVSDSDHLRLEATVYPDYCVVESHQISDASRGWRRVPITKVWRTEHLLGRGGFAEVHLRSQESNKDAKRALKIIPTRGVKLSIADCQRELTAMIEFAKPRYRDAAVFADFIGWFHNDEAMFLAMEYMPLGDLEQNIQEIENSPTHSRPPLLEEEVQEITRQILEGLKIMHAEGSLIAI